MPTACHGEVAEGTGERGLDVARPILAVLDGSKALRRAVLDVFDHPVIQRCQLHKIRNVKDHLPQRLRPGVKSRMREAYHANSALAAEASSRRSPASWTRPTPAPPRACARASPRPSPCSVGVPPTLARTMRSPNRIESMISICREHAGNIKRWRDEHMALRWCAAGMVEAGKQFRRVNGHLHLPALRAALERETTSRVTPACHDQTVNFA